MAFADYAYYIDTYHGNRLTAAQWTTVAERAADYITYITLGKATADYDAVKRCNCALAEVYEDLETARANAAQGAVASETVGAYSVSYRSNEEIAALYKGQVSELCARYLAPTGLLYRGCAVLV